MTWQEVMWKELDALSATEQFVTTGQWIAQMTQELLPALGDRRRQALLNALDTSGMDNAQFAESVGSRTTTIKRLVEEAKKNNRPHHLN